MRYSDPDGGVYVGTDHKDRDLLDTSEVGEEEYGD